MNDHSLATSRRFSLGALVMTPTALARLPLGDILDALRRHARGDWGDVPEEDQKANDQSMPIGARILSSYRSRDGVRFWVITEGDRSLTTVLLPEEY